MSRMNLTQFRLCALGVVFLLAPLVVGGQGPSPPPANKPIVGADHKRMQPEQADVGRSVTVLGDPSKAGMYITRNHFAPGAMSRPHFHDQDRYVTVIKGTWWTGEGDKFEPEKAVPIRTAGFMVHPAGYHHYDGAKDEEVIVQIMGMGPVKTTQTEVK